METNGQNRRIFKFGNFQIDAANRQLRNKDKLVSLPPKAFDLLLVLVENNGRLIEKDEIFTRVWKDQIVEESNLTVYISQIRKALGENRKNPRHLFTVPGFGYRFEAEVECLSKEDSEGNNSTVSLIDSRRVGASEFIRENAAAATVFPDKNEFENLREKDAFNADLPKSDFIKRGFAKYGAVFLTSFLICLTAGFGIYQYFNSSPNKEAFNKTVFSRLTNNGKIKGVAISPDGKYIAYVSGENEGDSLWVRQVGTVSSIRILAPVKAQFWSLTFTPDGKFIYYSLFGGDKADVDLFRIPFLGGISEKIPEIIAAFISFSPDGKRFAFVQPDSAAGYNYLAIADADGKNRQIIARKKHPDTFVFGAHTVAWSPDGETIACFVNHFDSDASYSTLVGINAGDGSERLLSQKRWYDVLSLIWLKTGGGFLISGSDKSTGGNQVRLLTYPEDNARQITNDLTDYYWLSATADGESFVTIQTNTVNGIFVGDEPENAESFREIISETGSLNPLVWTPDGKIVFRSSAGGISNLWMMEADGSNRRQLTADAQIDARGLCISPDGKYFVFPSWRSGKSNLWRVNSDGANLTQLTDGEVDSYPYCSPDAQTIVYQKGLHTQPTLWKVPVAGGEEPTALADFTGKWNSVSKDGNLISYFFMAEGKWRIGIVSSKNGQFLKHLDVPASLNEYETHWSIDNKSLFFIGTVGSVSNIWALPVSGAEQAKPVTNFKSHSISNFSWSPDGKKLALARTLSISDVILVSNENPP